MLETISSGAEFSPCGLYRYALWRRWYEDYKYALFIGLNPSTADETEDDPTIRRCKRFADDLGFGGVYMVNLFAYRATKPAVMKAASDPVGPENDRWLRMLAKDAHVVVCAWGAHGNYLQRDEQVIELLSDVDLMCLGVTKHGMPRHPLYIRADKELEPFRC